MLQKDRREGDIPGQPVRRELTTGAIPFYGISDTLGQKCFPDSWQVIQQDVTLSELPEERQIDVLLRRYHHVRNMFREGG